MLYPVQYLDLVEGALREDLGRGGDLTSTLTVPAEARCRAHIVARQAGCVAGLQVALHVFRCLDPALEVEAVRDEGARVAVGDVLLRLHGSARSVLAGERVALNFLGRLSGIADVTARGVAELAGTRARLVATRKTTPGLRMLEKWAVLSGGGEPHRFGLDDGILIKDNHVLLAGGPAEALRRVQRGAPHLLKIELEVDTLDQLAAALRTAQEEKLRLDAVLLDNFSLDDLRTAVSMVEGRAVLEASGGLTLGRLAAVAATGVDLLSLGALTHSAPNFDVALDVQPRS